MIATAETIKASIEDDKPATTAAAVASRARKRPPARSRA
jgi:hypothetical protein